MTLNYAFLVRLAARHVPPPARLLDFGCGGGEIIDLALAAGYDATGVDTYQNVWEQYAHARDRLAGRALRIEPGPPLPVADATFDIALSNQVFEHIAPLPEVAAELARVIKPGGLLIAMFPTREIIREPHLLAPFVHWPRNGGPAQRRLLALSHRLGLHNMGRHGNPRTDRTTWVASAIHSLRHDMAYRTVPEAIAAFAPGFTLHTRHEADFLADRLAHSRLRPLAPLARIPILEPALRHLAVRAAGVVLVLRRTKEA